ncbi:MAG: G8 domain-containing protein [Patescibacteria group bacterium]|nr:MAG: G8 domain-containing protein [Patescibacteria group bacterium]
MRKFRFFVVAAFLALGAPFAASAASPLIKGSTPAVYYVDEGKRYVFPNEKVYFSWYAGFSDVRTVSDEELASYLIGGHVTYKPGSRLVKLQSDPRVFAVGAGGRLRWIATETAARDLYGDNWNTKVDDLSDAFFFAYKEGEPVASAADFDMEAEQGVASIADDFAARNGAVSTTDFTAVRTGLWSDPAVWGGARPGAGARVTIPNGQKVTYDLENGPTLKSLDVLGTLEFAQDRSMRLAARQIVVRGAMTAGTPLAPFRADKRLEIALTGAATAPIADDGFIVDGGTLSLHGADVGFSWTRLAAPAAVGATEITLVAPVAWEAGSEIAVLGAGNEEQEVRVIKAVDGATITLDRPLEKTHRAEAGLRSEVALLDRNIEIHGVGNGYGSYVRGINRASMTLRNVELSSLGRKGVSGQHPLLFDGISKPVFASSVVKDAGNRCLTLRQTTGAEISDNVALNAYGHCFATEDGAETGNVFSGNLAARIRPGALLGDETPSAFLFRHPGNEVERNVAVGAAGFGYWYLLANEATTNGGVRLHPREALLGSFADNQARSNGKVGLYIDDGKGRGDYIPGAKATFSGFTSVLNGERGFWIRGVNLEMTNAFIAENPIGGTFAAFGALLRNSTIAGRLPGSASPGPAKYGFTFDDGPISVQDVAFERFEDGASALGFEERSEDLPDARSSFSGLTFTDATPWSAADPVTPGDHMAIVRDLDAGDVVGANSRFFGAECVLEEGNVRRCPGPYAQLEVVLRNGASNRNVVFTELGTGAAVTLAPGPAFDGEYAYATVAENGAYRVESPSVPVMVLSYSGSISPLLVRVPAGLGAAVRVDGETLPGVDLAALAAGSWAYDTATSEAVLWLRPGDEFELTR